MPDALSLPTLAVVGARDAGERDDRDLPGDLVDLCGLEHPVVQDQPVALARDRQDPAPRLVVGDVHRAQQQVEPAALRGPLHAPVEHVVELQGLGLVGERVVAEQPGGVPRAAGPPASTGAGIGEPADSGRRMTTPDDFLEPDRERAGGAVRGRSRARRPPAAPGPWSRGSGCGGR